MTVTETQGPRFDFGRVTSRISALIGRNLVPFLTLSLILVGVPYFLYLLIPLTLGADPGVAGPASLVAMLVLITGGLVLQAAITRASIDDLSGKKISIGTALSSGVAVALPLLGFGLLYGLGIGIGFVLLVVPGLYLATMWAVSGPIIVVERLGVFKAMTRSGVLTRNHRWAILGLLVLYMIFAAVVQGLIALAIPGGWATMALLPGGSILAVMALVAFQAFASIVGNVGIAATYFELRQIKEGVDVAELSNVFA